MYRTGPIDDLLSRFSEVLAGTSQCLKCKATSRRMQGIKVAMTVAVAVAHPAVPDGEGPVVHFPIQNVFVEDDD